MCAAVGSSYIVHCCCTADVWVCCMVWVIRILKMSC